MREPIRMPALSDTMQSGRLHQWLKQPGDAVHKGDVLAEVESDKAVMELEAFRDGYLAGPLAAVESDIPVGEVIGYVTDQREAEAGGASAQPAEPATPSATEPSNPEPTSPEPSRSAPAAAPPASVSPANEVPSVAATSADVPPAQQHVESASGGRRASPYARGLARELGLDLAQIPPGPDGVIRAAQVMAAAHAGPTPDLQAGPPFRYKLLTPMHRAVADNMVATLATPTFRISSQVDLMPLRDHAHQAGLSLSLLLARACALAVAVHRHFNAVYTPLGLALRERVDVGVAVDVPGGLVTPVLRDAAVRPLDELAEDWRALKDRAKAGRLQPADYQGATFYLSNLGVFPEVSRFEAIVPLGAAAILAVGAPQQGRVDLTLSCDHRVVFGADAARFLATLAARLAAPAGL